MVHRMTASDKEWHSEWQSMTTSSTTNGNERQRVVQRMTTNDSERQWVIKNDNEWQPVTASDIRNDINWEKVKQSDFKFQNEPKRQCGSWRTLFNFYAMYNYMIFLDSTKLKIVWIKITTFDIFQVNWLVQIQCLYKSNLYKSS